MAPNKNLALGGRGAIFYPGTFFFPEALGPGILHKFVKRAIKSMEKTMKKYGGRLLLLLQVAAPDRKKNYKLFIS